MDVEDLALYAYVNIPVFRSFASDGANCLNLQVLAALDQDYFDHLLPDIIRNCSHQKASIRDGHLTLFRVICPSFLYSHMTINVHFFLTAVSFSIVFA
jgi:hypothetical protein